jgi:hypothetical protein
MVWWCSWELGEIETRGVRVRGGDDNMMVASMTTFMTVKARGLAPSRFFRVNLASHKKSDFPEIDSF